MDLHIVVIMIAAITVLIAFNAMRLRRRVDKLENEKAPTPHKAKSGLVAGQMSDRSGSAQGKE